MNWNVKIYVYLPAHLESNYDCASITAQAYHSGYSALRLTSNYMSFVFLSNLLNLTRKVCWWKINSICHTSFTPWIWITTCSSLLLESNSCTLSLSTLRVKTQFVAEIWRSKNRFYLSEIVAEPSRFELFLCEYYSKAEHFCSQIMWTWAPPSDRQREGEVLSTLLAKEPFDFSNFQF